MVLPFLDRTRLISRSGYRIQITAGQKKTTNAVNFRILSLNRLHSTTAFTSAAASVAPMTRSKEFKSARLNYRMLGHDFRRPDFDALRGPLRRSFLLSDES